VLGHGSHANGSFSLIPSLSYNKLMKTLVLALISLSAYSQVVQPSAIFARAGISPDLIAPEQVQPVGTQPPVAVTPAPAVSRTLPSKLVGCGVSWNRGASYPLTMDCQYAMHIGSGNWYSWSSIDTPIATQPAGAPPLLSTLTTGGAYVLGQSASGRIGVVAIVQMGFSIAQTTSTAAPAFTGTAGIPFRPLKSQPNLYIMPYVKAASASTSTNSSGLATAVLQPGITMMYAFN
jgi:hypothetical protein